VEKIGFKLGVKEKGVMYDARGDGTEEAEMTDAKR